MTSARAGDPTFWRFRPNPVDPTKPHRNIQALTRWAFAPETDRREATLVMEFVASLLDDPDVGKPVTGHIAKVVGVQDIQNLRHEVPPGTATDVTWAFDTETGEIDVFGPGKDEEES